MPIKAKNGSGLGAMARAISAESLSDAISEVLEEYGDSVFVATEDACDAAEEILIGELQAASPRKSGKFAKGWKGTGRKYKLARFVGNTTRVKSKGRNIPLANIFEYSTTNHAQPFIKKTFSGCMDKMARAMVDTVKKGI